MTNRVDLSALDALAEAATEGPWYQHEGHYEGSGVHELYADDSSPIGDVRSWRPEEDAAFIVALRNAYPSLSAEVRALRAALDAATLLIRKAREAKNGTATDREGESLFGFVLDHHDYLALHATLNDAALKEPT